MGINKLEKMKDDFSETLPYGLGNYKEDPNMLAEYATPEPVSYRDATSNLQAITNRAGIINPSLSQMNPAVALPQSQIPSLTVVAQPRPPADPYRGQLDNIDEIENSVPMPNLDKGMLDDTLPSIPTSPMMLRME